MVADDFTSQTLRNGIGFNYLPMVLFIQLYIISIIGPKLDFRTTYGLNILLVGDLNYP